MKDLKYEHLNSFPSGGGSNYPIYGGYHGGIRHHGRHHRGRGHWSLVMSHGSGPPPPPDPITDHPNPLKSYLYPIFSTKAIVGVGASWDNIRQPQDAPWIWTTPRPYHRPLHPLKIICMLNIFNKNHHGGMMGVGCHGMGDVMGASDTP